MYVKYKGLLVFSLNHFESDDQNPSIYLFPFNLIIF